MADEEGPKTVKCQYCGLYGTMEDDMYSKDECWECYNNAPWEEDNWEGDEDE